MEEEQRDNPNEVVPAPSNTSGDPEIALPPKQPSVVVRKIVQTSIVRIPPSGGATTASQTSSNSGGGLDGQNRHAADVVAPKPSDGPEADGQVPKVDTSTEAGQGQLAAAGVAEGQAGNRQRGDQPATTTSSDQHEEILAVKKLFKTLMVLGCIILTLALVLSIIVILNFTGTFDSSDDSLDPSRAIGPPAAPTGPPTAAATLAPSSPPTSPPSTVPPLLNPEQVAKLLANDGGANGPDRFGRSVAIYGNTIVVGAPYEDDKNGSAYVYVQTSPTTWTQQAKLTASDATAFDYFGGAVAIFEDTIVVGTSIVHVSGGAGERAFVFERSGNAWSEQAILRASDGFQDAYFGASVGITAGTIVVGAAHAEAAYVFVGSGPTWTQQAKLTASSGTVFDDFGFSVAIDGDKIVIGAPYEDGFGSVYVFLRQGSTWNEQAKLTTGTAFFFGVVVAISVDTVVVGDSDGDSAYVFVRVGSAWTEQAHLTGAFGSAFGAAVAVSVDTIVVGALFNDEAYFFIRDNTEWVEQALLKASDFDSGDYFGASVAIGGGSIAVGSERDGESGFDSGSVYVFQ